MSVAADQAKKSNCPFSPMADASAAGAAGNRNKVEANKEDREQELSEEEVKALGFFEKKESARRRNQHALVSLINRLDLLGENTRLIYALPT